MRAFCLITALALPMPVMAHPHVFVRTEITVVFEEDGEVGVRLDWYYDEFFSLLVTTDLGIDLDGDMVLTKDEQVLLDEQITTWPDDYNGDLEVMQGDQILPLAEKRDHRMTYNEGLFHEVHLRPIAEIADRDAELKIRAYDPTYYVAYDVVEPIKIEGRDDCEAKLVRADMETANALVADLLDGQSASDVGPDEYFPEVGEAFADTVTVTCAQPL